MRKTHHLTEFRQEAARFAASLTPLEGRATVVGLYGDLGSGKTTFVQAVGKALGVTETVNSPTFLIVKQYTLSVQRFETLVHVDAYRLKHSNELRKLRFEELLRDPHNLILIEWADKVIGLLPSKHITIYLQFIDDSTRAITID